MSSMSSQASASRFADVTSILDHHNAQAALTQTVTMAATLVATLVTASVQVAMMLPVLDYGYPGGRCIMTNAQLSVEVTKPGCQKRLGKHICHHLISGAPE
ncbi:uncharacterized protein EI90DRAFT_3127126 [Cantharellus anzutake]|uniref:uncharacterized protein n=1 Tax=Cantharellus anzutake TaxID=1750568 RepID=UPI0019037B5F|nr:uncharacterized protein EI90DRAFT_3127126 [Cantharellus anzutake]KAF8327451.1 hypothetical protein EI90DRAFT_3127126 [Cantharellus anzutake]